MSAPTSEPITLTSAAASTLSRSYWDRLKTPAERAAATAPARESQLRRIEDQLDPEHLLEPADRRRLALDYRAARARAGKASS